MSDWNDPDLQYMAHIKRKEDEARIAAEDRLKRRRRAAQSLAPSYSSSKPGNVQSAGSRIVLAIVFAVLAAAFAEKNGGEPAVAAILMGIVGYFLRELIALLLLVVAIGFVVNMLNGGG